MANSPTQNSLASLRAQGYICWIVEYYNSFSRKRVDMFAAWDLIALRENEVLFVQTTSASNVSARVKKIAGNEYTPDIRKAGVRLEVHGWSSKKVGNRRVYSQRVVDVS
jgi:hypothetical protein